MSAIHHTVYEYDWVRVVAPQTELHRATLKAGGHTHLIYQQALAKPARTDRSGEPIQPDGGEVTVEVEPSAGLYVRTVGHRSSGVWVEEAPTIPPTVSISEVTGWASYHDTQYTEESPLALGGDDQWTELPNNAEFVIDGQKPADIDTFYDQGKIIGRAGDGMGVTVRFKVQGNTNGLYSFHTGIDIGGDFGVLFPTHHTPPKGKNREQPIAHGVMCYNLDTWEANGGTVMIRPRNAIRVYDISFLIHRLHKAR